MSASSTQRFVLASVISDGFGSVGTFRVGTHSPGCRKRHRARPAIDPQEPLEVGLLAAAGRTFTLLPDIANRVSRVFASSESMNAKLAKIPILGISLLADRFRVEHLIRQMPRGGIGVLFVRGIADLSDHHIPGDTAGAARVDLVRTREDEAQQSVQDSDVVDRRSGFHFSLRFDVVNARGVDRRLGDDVFGERDLRGWLQMQLERIDVLSRRKIFPLEVRGKPEQHQHVLHGHQMAHLLARDGEQDASPRPDRRRGGPGRTVHARSSTNTRYRDTGPSGHVRFRQRTRAESWLCPAPWATRRGPAMATPSSARRCLRRQRRVRTVFPAPALGKGCRLGRLRHTSAI